MSQFNPYTVEHILNFVPSNHQIWKAPLQMCLFKFLIYLILIASRTCGFVHVIGEEVEDSKYDVTMELYAKKLDKKDFFGKVRCYAVI